MAYRIYTTHRSVDLDDLSRSERSAEEALERGTAVEQVEAEDAEAEEEAAGTPR